MSRISPKTTPKKEVQEQNEIIKAEQVNTLDSIIDNKKKELIEQTAQINKINNANKIKINELQKELDNSSQMVTKLTEMENEVKKLIDNHKRTIENPNKTRETIIELEKEIDELNNSAKEITDRCISKMSDYSEYLKNFL